MFTENTIFISCRPERSVTPAHTQHSLAYDKSFLASVVSEWPRSAPLMGPPMRWHTGMPLSAHRGLRAQLRLEAPEGATFAAIATVSFSSFWFAFMLDSFVNYSDSIVALFVSKKKMAFLCLMTVDQRAVFAQHCPITEASVSLSVRMPQHSCKYCNSRWMSSYTDATGSHWKFRFRCGFWSDLVVGICIKKNHKILSCQNYYTSANVLNEDEMLGSTRSRA